jgi:hypothetical protein
MQVADGSKVSSVPLSQQYGHSSDRAKEVIQEDWGGSFRNIVEPRLAEGVDGH